MLREFEQKAAEEEPKDAASFLNTVRQDVVGALFSALELDHQLPSLPRRLIAEVAKTAIGYIPEIGPYTGPTVAAAEMGADWLRNRRS